MKRVLWTFGRNVFEKKAALFTVMKYFELTSSFLAHFCRMPAINSAMVSCFKCFISMLVNVAGRPLLSRTGGAGSRRPPGLPRRPLPPAGLPSPPRGDWLNWCCRRLWEGVRGDCNWFVWDEGLESWKEMLV